MLNAQLYKFKSMKSIRMLFYIFTGNTFLYTTMAVEIMGRWKNTCTYDGSRYWHMLRSGEKTKEENIIRLFMG